MYGTIERNLLNNMIGSLHSLTRRLGIVAPQCMQSPLNRLNIVRVRKYQRGSWLS